MKISADFYKTTDGIQGGVQSKNEIYKKIDPSFETFSYSDACRGLNQPFVPLEQLRFREWEANYVLQRYIDLIEKVQPEELDLIIYNAICGGYIKHKTRTISVLNDNYVEMSDRLYAGNYLDLNNYKMFRRMYLKLQLDSCKNADLVAAESQTDADYYKTYGIESTVIENGVDHNFWTALPDKAGIKAKYNIPEDKKVGIFVGAFTPIKGYHIYHDMIMKNPDMHWLMVLKHPIDQNVKSDNVSVACQVDPDLLKELYSASDFFVLPSIWESGHNLASLEALSCNLPILVSGVGGYEEHLGVQDFGVAVEKWDENSFSEGLKTLLDGDFKARDALFNHKWDFDNYKSRWEAVIKE